MRNRGIKLKMLLFSFAVIAGMANAETVQTEKKEGGLQMPHSLLCEYRENPLGVDSGKPRLSWFNESGTRGQKQTTYQILVSDSPEKLAIGKGNIWDSGLVQSGENLNIEYAGEPLKSRMKYYWKVRVADKDGRLSPWSENAFWSMGLLNRSDWGGKWIGKPREWADSLSADDRPYAENPWLRKTFELSGKPEKAMLYLASLGYHELYVNGRKVTENILTPNLCDWATRARYIAYDIAPFLKPGKNVIAVWLGTGWARLPAYNQPNYPLCLVDADIQSTGGSMRIVSDETWKIAPSNTALTGTWTFGNFGGEYIDCNRDNPGWNSETFDDSRWADAETYPLDLKLSSEMSEGNIRGESIPAIAVFKRGEETWVIDFGKNMTGFFEIELTGKPGSEALLQFSERENIPVSYRNESKIKFGPSGKGVSRNRFNYECGRWVLVSGITQAPKLETSTAYNITSGLKKTAKIKTSDELLNWIYDTAIWSIDNLNLGSYLVDCHNRERLGYGAEGQYMGVSLLANYRAGAFLSKWNQDWHDVLRYIKPGISPNVPHKQQGKQYLVPYTAPTYEGGGGPFYTSVCVNLPWEMYLRYSDRRLLEESYPTIQKWMEFLDSKTENGMLYTWSGDWDFLGDWVPPEYDQGIGRVDAASTNFFNNVFYFDILNKSAKIAELLGKKEDAAIYRKRSEILRKNAHEKFFNKADNTYANGTQTYMATPLLLNFVPDELRESVRKQLEHDILVKHNGSLDTGVSGTVMLFRLLAKEGAGDTALEMLQKETYPSYGYMRRCGATSLWEQWNGEHARLHSSFVTIAEWFVEGLLGIRPDPATPGYRNILIKPSVSRKVGWVEGEVETPRGIVRSAWKMDGDTLEMNVTIPVNATAMIYIPASGESVVTENGVLASKSPGVRFLEMDGKSAVFSLESGSYCFRVPFAL